jgi:HAE1 family hydrophobic/amphiphilic exporter-1
VKIIQESIRYPVTTAVGVILLILFGVLALNRIPVQLTPEVERPQLFITTLWPGASPNEIEREIVDEQEEQLKSLEGLIKMESASRDSAGILTLTFQVGTSIDAALLRVANRLEQVPAYPDDADKPVITSSNVDESAIAWWALRPSKENGFVGDMASLYDFVSDFVEPELERVPGVGNSNFYGGQPREMQVIVNPAELAARRVTINELGAALDRENRNYSGGDFEEGKRRYVVRTVGEYSSTEDIENIVVALRNGIPVYLRDVARAQLGFRKPTDQVFMMSTKVIIINAIRVPGANVLQVMADLKQTVQHLNDDLLAAQGLELIQVYDQTEYIHSAIALVRQSLVIGGALAILVLLLYLRSVSSTLIISVAIPISVVGSLLMMYWLGRTLNVVSLAGLAFAVGMVVDNSIVVLENIYRHRQLGKSRRSAALDATREVWGAVLASTLTTVAVFLPIAFMEEEVGQLFGDIAIAITCAVALSLIVSITVIPSLSAKILRAGNKKSGASTRSKGIHPGRAFARLVVSIVTWINRSTLARLAVIIVLTTGALGFSYLLMPKAEYLPVGNQNFLFGFILPPPGYSVDEVADMRQAYEQELSYLWESTPGSPEAAAQPGGGIKGFFFVALSDSGFMGVEAGDPLRARELMPEFQKVSLRLPGSFVVLDQLSIFMGTVDEGRNIDIEFTGPDLERLIELGIEAFGRLLGVLPDSQILPIPSLDLGNPEVQVLTHRRRAAEVGLSNRDLGFTVSALIDGVKASDFRYQGREIDLKIMSGEGFERRTHLLEQLPIATPTGQLVSLGSVADISEVNGPVQINHRERERVIMLRVNPTERMPLESAIELIEEQVVDPMTAAGKLGGLYRVSLSGTADKLAQTGRALQLNLVLALVITYLLLAALFESFLYPDWKR